MNHRPYPDRDRALAQVERRPKNATCPRCSHQVGDHAFADGIATCGPGGRPDSCLACAKARLRMPSLQGLAELAHALAQAPRLVVLTGRQAGRTGALKTLEVEALARGEHVHRASVVDGVHCLGGYARCTTPRLGNTQEEARQ